MISLTANASDSDFDAIFFFILWTLTTCTRKQGTRRCKLAFVSKYHLEYNRMFSPQIKLVHKTKDFSLASITFFSFFHQHGCCAFVFKILREWLQTTYMCWCPWLQEFLKVTLLLTPVCNDGVSAEADLALPITRGSKGFFTFFRLFKFLQNKTGALKHPTPERLLLLILWFTLS